MELIGELVDAVFSSRYSLWVLVVVLVLGLGRVASRVGEEKRRQDARIRAAAERAGLSATHLAPPGPEPPRLVQFECLGCCNGQALRPLMSGTWMGTAVHVFEHSHSYSTEMESERVTETLACFVLEEPFLPPFVVERHLDGGRLWKLLERWRGEQAIDVGPHPPFSSERKVRRHRAHEVGDADIRRVFSTPVLDSLARCPELHVESLGRQVLFYRRGRVVEPEDVEAFLSETHGLVVALVGASGAHSPS
jgi:hypothetical protein